MVRFNYGFVRQAVNSNCDCVFRKLGKMKHPRVLVIDSGMGNISSVVAALHCQDCDLERACLPPSDASAFTHAVLPSVGSFAAGMEALCVSGWGPGSRSSSARPTGFFSGSV